MYHRINNQLPNSIRRNFVNILSVNANNRSPKMNIPQDKLKCFLYLLPQRTGILSAVNKNLFCCSFKHTTLGCHMKSPASR